MSELREYTTDEIRQLFLEKMWTILDYWEKLPEKTEREKMEGMLHSILVTIDGGAIDLPGFILAPLGDPSDIEYYKESGEKWFPVNEESDVKGDIGGILHDLMFKYK